VVPQDTAKGAAMRTQRQEWAAGLAGHMRAWARWTAAALPGVAVALLVLWLVLVVPRLLVPAASEASLQDVPDPAKRHELQDSRLKLQNDVRTTLLQGFGGLAVLAGAVFAFGQLLTSRRQLEHTIESAFQQHELDRQGQVTERFTRAIDQLGHENLDVRLGGIYALERIANDSHQDRATIAEVLTAFVRGHAPWSPPRPDQDISEDGRIEGGPLQRRVPDVQAALTVLGRRKLPINPAEPLNLLATNLRSADLRRANLREATLAGCQLQGAGLIEADLQGAFLDGAELQDANLVRAQLQRADLYDAQLQRASLRDARLQGADLRGAQLQGADLRGAQLQGARCSTQTVWPDGFDWKTAGVELAVDLEQD
jgi:hypothetical protein